ncbi:hypothetical protein JOL79_00005 [Microbispora sp. RL4-1S]|uniref:MmyB-like transcription regulator ligand binding domain-containing protein n=1 Tax=Microbispora oryzae TaxID=2806554 RepID=A0A941AMY7_9ACTN|nr:hypothetical protein [Microbispora oryzae]
MNRRLDILAMNQVTTALFEWLPHHDNLVRLTFLNPEARYPRWEQEAMSDVAHLHAEAGSLGGDPFLMEMVEELSTESEDFGRLWARHDVRARNQEFVHLRHPEVGEMTLRHETVRFDSAPDPCVFLGEPEPGSPSGAAVRASGRADPPPAHPGPRVARARSRPARDRPPAELGPQHCPPLRPRERSRDPRHRRTPAPAHVDRGLPGPWPRSASTSAPSPR